ncbi:Retrotransposon gag protein [Gossypium australe]|uniref:Retrotransposon gag protein n=1 Tax=Gossypium australe TaxID=47621 RepID=A0A5B6V481_9ROSI|nr:Retrotransposon gag protein [Gossypium australe]
MDLENQNDVQGNIVANAQNPILIVYDRDRPIRQYVVPLLNELDLGIRRPEIEVPQFELKHVMFQMLQIIGQFSGMSIEDLHLHLRLFTEVRDSFKIASYFPPRKNAKLRNQITTFQQLDDESLYEAWERFKLLCRCCHHGILHCIQLETIYNGLNAHIRFVVDASTNRVLLLKSYNEAYEVIEKIASNNYQWMTNQVALGRRVVGVHEVEALTLLSAQVAAQPPMYYQGGGPNNTYMQHRSNQPLGFNQEVQHPLHVESSNNLENLLKAYIVKNDALI